MEAFVLFPIMILGCLQCFFGYETFKIVLWALGFAFGFMVGSTGLYHNNIAALLSGLVGGVIGAALMGVFYLFGLFMIGALFGGMIGGVLSSLFQSHPNPALISILALFCGFLAVRAQKLMIIALTSFEGAWLIAVGMNVLLSPTLLYPSYYHFLYPEEMRLGMTVPIWLLLGISGFTYQHNKNFQTN